MKTEVYLIDHLRAQMAKRNRHLDRGQTIFALHNREHEEEKNLRNEEGLIAWG